MEIMGSRDLEIFWELKDISAHIPLSIREFKKSLKLLEAPKNFQHCSYVRMFMLQFFLMKFCSK